MKTDEYNTYSTLYHKCKSNKDNTGEKFESYCDRSHRDDLSRDEWCLGVKKIKCREKMGRNNELREGCKFFPT